MFTSFYRVTELDKLIESNELDKPLESIRVYHVWCLTRHVEACNITNHITRPYPTLKFLKYHNDTNRREPGPDTQMVRSKSQNHKKIESLRNRNHEEGGVMRG